MQQWVKNNFGVTFLCSTYLQTFDKIHFDLHSKIRHSSICLAGLLVRRDEWLINQASDVPSIIFKLTVHFRSNGASKNWEWWTFFLVVFVRLSYIFVTLLLLGVTLCWFLEVWQFFGQWVVHPIDPGTQSIILSNFEKYKVQMGIIWLKNILQKWSEPIEFSAWLDAKKWYIACLYNINPSGARTFKSRFSCLYLLLVRNTKDDAHIFLDL